MQQPLRSFRLLAAQLGGWIAALGSVGMALRCLNRAGRLAS